MRLCALLFLALADGVALALEPPALPDLRDIARENRELAALIEEIDAGREFRLGEIKAMGEALTREERTLTADDITPEMLREARLDLDTVRSRSAVVQGRIEQRRLSLERLGEQLAELERLPPVADGDSTAALRLEAARELLTEQARLTEGIVAAYGELLTLGQRYGDLRAQRLRLLQSRLRLRAVDQSLFAADNRLPLLESVIDQHMRRAARFANRRGELDRDDPSLAAERDALSVQIDDAVTRGFLRQNDLELILAEQQLDDLNALRDDDLMPLQVLRDAERKLTRVGAVLRQVGDSLTAQRQMLQSRRESLLRRDGADPAAVAVIDDLNAMIDLQQSDVDALRARVDAERKDYARTIGDTYARELARQRPIPTTAADWQRLGENALHLPQLLGQALAAHGGEVQTAWSEAPPGKGLLAIAGSLALALLIIGGGRRLKALALAQAANSHVTLFLRPLAKVAPLAVPAALWLFVASLYAVPGYARWPVLLLLALWPLLAFVLALVRRLLFHHAAPAGSADERRRFYRRLKLGLIIATLIAALYILTRALPVAPILADMLDRLAMLGVLALVLPAFALRTLLKELGTSAPRRERPRLRFLAWVARALPPFLIGTGLVGLVGYTELAWVVLSSSAWVIVVGLMLFLVIGLLLDVKDRLAAHLGAGEAELGAFWTTHFVEPGYRLGVLLAFVAAGWALFQLWGWSADTPIVRGVVGFIGQPIFELGTSSFSVSDILLALLLVGGAFYVGGWSQQVSYNLAYHRVADSGLRQALATFTQYVVIVAGVLLALKIIGFDLTTLAVFAGALGVGIGFGLQNIVNNFVSGLLLLAERPLKVGDLVSIGNNMGTVSQIGIRSLTVRTLDRQEVIIPNGSVISGEFMNWTRTDDVQRNVHYIPIRRCDDPAQAIALIKAVLEAHPHVLKEPAPGAFLWDFGEFSANLRVQYCFHINAGPGGLVVRSEVLMGIARALREHGIEMPYPQRDVALRISAEDRAWLPGPAGGSVPGDGDTPPLPAVAS